MQTCFKCNAQSPDTASYCFNCTADLSEFSNTMVALKKFQANSRVDHVIVATYDNACPACLEHQGAFPKDSAPILPIKGCSHPNGCRCFYQPVLNDIFP